VIVAMRSPKPHPRLYAGVISGAVVFFATLIVIVLQSFTVADTTCNGVILRVATGGSFSSSDGLCQHREMASFYASVGIVMLAAALIAVTFVWAGKGSTRDQS